MLIYPAAFNMTTGPLHWELLQRARANDLQLYVASISPARDPNFEYVAWGHSMVVGMSSTIMFFFYPKRNGLLISKYYPRSLLDPWGKVVITAKESEEIIYADIGMCILMMKMLTVFFSSSGFDEHYPCILSITYDDT